MARFYPQIEPPGRGTKGLYLVILSGGLSMAAVEIIMKVTPNPPCRRKRLPLDASSPGSSACGSHCRAELLPGQPTILFWLLLILSIFGPLNHRIAAATLWTGAFLTFTEPAGGNGSDPSNQDRLSSDVWLTRNATQGLFNAAQETSYTHFSSPADTEWAFGTLANYSTLSYANWETWNGHNPPAMVGRPAVLHLISDDIYLSVEFLSWGGVNGGFSYERSTAVIPEPGAGVLVLGGLALSLTLAVTRCRARF